MAFLDDLGKKISSAAQTTVQKSKELADSAKNSMAISAEEKEIDRCYKELGAWYYKAPVSYTHLYAEIGRRMDIQNFIDWNIVEAWSNNADLGNIKYWRERSPEGKWRWIAYDFDLSLIHIY